MRTFFGLPHDVDERNAEYNNIWKSQVLLSKVSNIAMETSDTFTRGEFNLSFQALEDLAKEQEKLLNER